MVPVGAVGVAEFLEKFVERTKPLSAGDPLDPSTIIGPLINQGAVDLVHERITDALAKGARLHTGGTSDGLIFQPTILTDVPYDATAANEETFGPLVIVEAADTPEDAVAVANRVNYGLTSTILTADTYRGFEPAPKVLHGIVNVNSPTVNDEIHAPMGGVRDSGWGRTGPDSIADFTDMIWINATSKHRQFPLNTTAGGAAAGRRPAAPRRTEGRSVRSRAFVENALTDSKSPRGRRRDTM